MNGSQLSPWLTKWIESTRRTRTRLKKQTPPEADRSGCYWTRDEVHEAVMRGEVEGRTPGAVRAKLEREGLR